MFGRCAHRCHIGCCRWSRGTDPGAQVQVEAMLPITEPKPSVETPESGTGGQWKRQPRGRPQWHVPAL